ncbi:hypothetical protein [Taibaiella koreensis]|uniref:hypothetical protein n=1 Tax=Taibaiella koreensis TaxID=1268548 RepID=UPI0013C2B5E4|nr:hypothetical protein [Taibaiella koreensis]
MKWLWHAFFCIFSLLLAACGEPRDGQTTGDSDTLSSGQTGNTVQVSDTLQYIGAASNNDRSSFSFINRKLDTIIVRWNNPNAGLTNKAVFRCIWTKTQPSAGSAAINEMKVCEALALPPFVNPDIKPADRRISYLFYANGGTIGYLNDGTVVGCPRCDANAGNAEKMLTDPPMGTYVVLKDGSLLVNGESIERPEIKKEWNEWMIFDTKEKWDAFVNDVDDLSTARNQQYLLQFVNGYLQQLDRNKGPEAERNWVLSNENVTDSFKYQYRQLLAQTEPLEADPVLDAQDSPGGQLVIHSYSEEDRYFWLSAGEGNEMVLVARLKLERGRWLVDGCGAVNIPANKRLHR